MFIDENNKVDKLLCTFKATVTLIGKQIKFVQKREFLNNNQIWTSMKNQLM